MSKLIGTTETYDPCFVPDWDKRLLDVNIIITKELTDSMIDKILANKDKIILHHTVTGMGGSLIEPKAKSPSWEFSQFDELIFNGFPIDQYVLRIDPIIPWYKFSLAGVRDVLNQWMSWRLSRVPEKKIRCRISLIDVYPHIRAELSNKCGGIPDNINFSYYPDIYYEVIEKLLEPFKDDFRFEACAEPGFTKSEFIQIVGCASHRDVMALHKNDMEYEAPKIPQRNTCTCLSKKQILGVKPGKCPHGCIYCYWKS